MSTRTLTSSMQTELAGDVIRPFFAFKAEFNTGDLRLWTGYGEVTVNSETYVGGGDILNMTLLTETNDIQARGVDVSLTGMRSSILSTVLSQARYGKTGTMYLGLLTSSGTVIEDPYMVFRGRLDVPSIEDSGETCDIRVTYESALIDLRRARVRHYTPHDQMIDYATDKGFEYVAALQDKTLHWGGASHRPSASSGDTESSEASPAVVKAGKAHKQETAD